MNIVSLSFALFTLIVLGIYYFLPKERQNLVLLAASLVFYLTWNPFFPILLLGVAGVNYWLGKQLPPAKQPPRSRLWVGIGFNVAVLGFFAYFDFFAPDSLPLRILLPVGLSFYSLQCISYLVDVSRKQVPADRPFTDFVLYLVYFPKLTAGPIERARPFLKSLAKPRLPENVEVGRSLGLIVVGLVRKVVVADVILGGVPEMLFETPGQFPAPALLFWLFAWVFGLYNDFAGYTNIVRGVSGLFGIPLTRNFAHPFFARNFSEFWNSWHISLSNWLRDYIFFPINRALVRRNPGRRTLVGLALPPLVTMLVSGLWHGTGMNFLLWGGLIGLFMVVEQIPAMRGPVVPVDERPLWQRLLRMGIIAGLFVGSGIFFVMSVPQAIEFVGALTDWGGWAFFRNTRLLLLVLLILVLDIGQYRTKDELFFLRWPVVVRSAVLALALLAIFFFSQVGPVVPFVYQGF